MDKRHARAHYSMDGIISRDAPFQHSSKIPIDFSEANHIGAVVSVDRPLHMSPSHRSRLLFYSRLAKDQDNRKNPYIQPSSKDDLATMLFADELAFRLDNEPRYAPRPASIELPYQVQQSAFAKIRRSYRARTTSLRIRRLKLKHKLALHSHSD